MEIKHTPTPWRIEPKWSGDNLGADGKDVLTSHLAGGNLDVTRGKAESEANVAFAVLACNAHDELMAALEMCRWELNEMEKRTPGQEEALTSAHQLLERLKGQGLDGSANNG